jgi:hypothetical protein
MIRRLWHGFRIFPKLPGGEPRKGFLRPEMYQKLLLELPEHLRQRFVIAYHVGLRRGTLLRIRMVPG